MSGGWQQTSLGEPHIAFLQRRPFHPFPISSDLAILYVIFNLDVKAVTKNDQKLFHQLLVGSVRSPSRLTKKNTFIWWKNSLDVRANTPKATYCPKFLIICCTINGLISWGWGWYRSSPKLFSTRFCIKSTIAYLNPSLIIHPYSTVKDINHVHTTYWSCNMCLNWDQKFKT